MCIHLILQKYRGYSGCVVESRICEPILDMARPVVIVVMQMSREE
jgi:hypothetical protein